MSRAKANGQVEFADGRYGSLLYGSRRETRSRTRETREACSDDAMPGLVWNCFDSRYVRGPRIAIEVASCRGTLLVSMWMLLTTSHSRLVVGTKNLVPVVPRMGRVDRGYRLAWFNP